MVTAGDRDKALSKANVSMVLVNSMLMDASTLIVSPSPGERTVTTGAYEGTESVTTTFDGEDSFRYRLRAVAA